MSSGPRLVHKQFNSPIGLYSQQNIKETLSKHIQDLGNGTVGIDFNNPQTDKPANLANSAVLRMLEEEERNRRGYPKLDDTQVTAILETMVRVNHRFDGVWPPARGMRPARSWDGQLNATNNVYSEFLRATKGKDQKKVVWPPAPETNGYHSPQAHAQPRHSPAPAAQPSPPQQRQQPRERQIPIQIQQDPAPPQQHQPPPHYQQTPQYQPAPQYQQTPHYQPAPQYQQSPAPQYQQSPQHQPAPQYQQAPAPQPSFCEGRRQQQCGLSKLIPATQAYGPGPTSPVPQPFTKQPSRWAPVSPVSPQAYGSQPSYPQQQQDYSQPPFSPPPEYQRTFEPPPSTITLRQQQPVHQKPPPVFASQPAAASFNGGVNMRGDQKWPPQEVREAVAAENEARRQLAKGPACRPRKVKKDYTSFFSQHALNNNYPGYRAPPGTQHYEELSGRSSY